MGAKSRSLSGLRLRVRINVARTSDDGLREGEQQALLVWISQKARDVYLERDSEESERKKSLQVPTDVCLAPDYAAVCPRGVAVHSRVRNCLTLALSYVRPSPVKVSLVHCLSSCGATQPRPGQPRRESGRGAA